MALRHRLQGSCVAKKTVLPRVGTASGFGEIDGEKLLDAVDLAVEQRRYSFVVGRNGVRL